MDWIHPWIGLDWVRSFVRFIVFPKTEAPPSSVFFRENAFFFVFKPANYSHRSIGLLTLLS